MESRYQNVAKALQADEGRLKDRLTITLTKMKDERLELLQITLEEQIGKLVGEIAVNFLRWIVS